MKKLFTLMLCISAFATMASSKTIYVNGTTGSDSNTGTSWASALRSIPYALTVASASGDNLWITGGTYDIPGTSTFTQGNTNMYGGFLGNEAYLSSRPKSDLDGNGIVEPWEFTNASVLTFNVTDINAINFTGSAFDGFTLSATATFNNNQSACLYLLNNWSNFSNNTIKNNNLTCSATTAWGGYYPFFTVGGTVNNCLFENNAVKITTSVFIYCNPFININASGQTTIGTKFLNSVIRNNKVTVDGSAVPSGTDLYGIRGMILEVAGGMNPTVATANTGGLPTTISNCVIHNNEMAFVPSTVSGPTFLSSAAVMHTSGSKKYNNVAQPTTDSIINCTVANNKGIRTNFCGISIGSDATSYHYIINNVFYNNQRATTGTNWGLNNMIGTISSNVGLISNNFTNGVGLTNSAGQIVNQDNTLGTGSNEPNFVVPTTTIGNTTDGSSELSNWKLDAGSYLIGKGIATSRLADKAGVAFATPRAVGAYEYVPTPTSLIESVEGNQARFYLSNGKLVSAVDGKAAIINLLGAILWNGNISTGQVIGLPHGAYVIRSTTEKGTSIQKISL